MERRISVAIFQPNQVNHLQRWSRIFRSEETETDFSIWIPTEISGIFGIMESRLSTDELLMSLRKISWAVVAVMENSPSALSLNLLIAY